MKISWNSLKISLAGAKLSHLVQKDKIWDHGSMIEQAKTTFYKLKKIKTTGNVEDIEKYLTAACYEKLKNELKALDKNGKAWIIKNPVIKEVAVIEVSVGKHNKPDCFVAQIKAMGIEFIADKYLEPDWKIYSKQVGNFSEQWSFVRQGDWWLLDGIKGAKHFF
jgi:predicted lipid-binding transport protein (Tim44 family)